MQAEYQLGTPLHPSLVMGLNRRTIPGSLDITTRKENEGTGYVVIDKWKDPQRGKQKIYVPVRKTTSDWGLYLIPLYGYIALFSVDDVDNFFRGEFHKGPDRIDRYYGVQLDY